MMWRCRTARAGDWGTPVARGVTGIAGVHAFDRPGRYGGVGAGADRDLDRPLAVVAALVAAGYRVFAINPVQVPLPGAAQYLRRQERRRRRARAGRYGSHRFPPAARGGRGLRAGGGDQVIARTHQTMIWDRQRHVLRLRTMLREYFPAALEAFGGVIGDLAAADVSELLDRAPDPDSPRDFRGEFGSPSRLRPSCSTWSRVMDEEARSDDRRGRRQAVSRARSQRVRGWAEALPRLSDQKARPAAGWASPRHGGQADDASAPSPSGGRGAASASAPWAAWR